MPPPVYNPLAGVKKDFSDLMQRFIETNSVRYEQFVEIWQEMKMSLIFAGRQTDVEAREFAEECLALALTYIHPANEFQQQVGGLYMMYGIYFKQPLEPKAKIRVTALQWQYIANVLTEVNVQKHFDVECIYWTLKHQNAYQFVGAASTKSLLGPDQDIQEDATQKSMEVQVEVDQLLQQRSAVSEMMGSDANAIDQLSAIHDQYHRHKCALLGPNAKKPQVSLDMIDANLVQHITKKITTFEWWKKNRAGKKQTRRRHDSGPTTSESEGESESERAYSAPRRSKNIGNVRALIKEKAMRMTGNASRSRRHRQPRNLSDMEPSPSRANVSQSSKADSDEEDSFRNDSLDPSLSSSLTTGLLPSMPTLDSFQGKVPKGRKRKKRQPKENVTKKPRAQKLKIKKETPPRESNTEAKEAVTESSDQSPKKKKVPTATLR